MIWGVALALLVSRPNLARADEPVKPTASATEKNPAVPAAGHSIHGETFDDGPRHRAYLMPGMGKIHFAATTAKPEAQTFIDQGVAQLHSFYYFESERSFRQAAHLDPQCAIAYWGMAMSNINNPKRAKGFLQEARKRADKASAREKLYIDALEALFRDGQSDKARKDGWLSGLETIVQDYPGDIDARAWLAMVTWQNSMGGAIGSRQAVDVLIDTVLQVEPMHPGAHHYRIHLWDGVKPARAEKSAALFGKSAPGIAHAWHMPGHTYTGLERYADAAYQQEASARVDHAYMIRDRVMPFTIHNYAHNNQWLCTSLSHIGRVHDAIAVARNLVEQPRDPEKNGPNDGGSAQRSGRLRWAEVLTRYELWDDLIAATSSGVLDWSNITAERREKAHTLGLAYAAKGDRARLNEQIEALKTLAAEQRKAAGNRSGTSREETETQEALAELEGYKRLAEGDVGAAFERFAKAPAMRPEALARAHLTARNYGFAESEAKAAVRKQTNQVPPLAAQVEILHAVGKDEAARTAFRELEALARHADSDVPVFRRLAPIVASWKNAKPVPAEAEKPSDEAAAQRVDLATLGPLVWSPPPAPALSLVDTDGKTWSLASKRGKNVVLIFFLGGKCAHCMQQLQVFGKEERAFQSLNTEVVAIGTDDLAATRALKQNADGVKFPMPLLPDPKLEVFKAYGAVDDFENHPLHATFLIDPRGGIRFERVSADPFLDVEFIKQEAARVMRNGPGRNP
jgi:peroxiredoxin